MYIYIYFFFLFDCITQLRKLGELTHSGKIAAQICFGHWRLKTFSKV